MHHRKDTFCSFCGTKFANTDRMPRACAVCGNTLWGNPTPVAVAIVPVRGAPEGFGFIAVRRAIEPKRGELAFPGGFVNHRESGAMAASRELLEETGIAIPPHRFRFMMEYISREPNLLLTFWETDPLYAQELTPFVPNDEADALALVRPGHTLAFESHTAALARYYDLRRG